jgi:hypothetical protein
MSKDKTKKVTITLTESQQNIARESSLELLGKENISGYIGYLICKDQKNGKR